MADFYVVGAAAYAPASGRNGSQAAPWVWGVDTIVGAGKWGGGDVLHLVLGTGWDALSAVFSVPNHINSSNNNRAIIDGGGLVEMKFANPAHFAYNVRANTVFRNFKSISAILTTSTAVNCAYIDIEKIENGQGNQSCIGFGDGHNYNVYIARCGFSSTVAPTVGGTRGAVVYRPTAGVAGSFTWLTVEDCVFENYEAIRGVISIMTSNDGAQRVQDIVLRRLKFKDYKGLAIDIEVAGPQSDATLGVNGTPGWSAGIIVEDIEFENGATQTISAGGYFGGGVFLSGFGLSPTPGFGPNWVRRLKAKNISGDAGLVDLLYGTYQGGDFFVDTMSTPHIDGCVLLLDIGCYDCRFEGIVARNITGKAGQGNSGAVVMVLDNVTNCLVAGIDADNVKCLLFVGSTGSKCGVTLANFTVTGAFDFGVRIASSATLVDNIKLVSGTASGTGQWVNSDRGAQWKGEGGNIINFSQANRNHVTASDTRSGVDPMLDPVTRRPLPNSPMLRAGKYVGTRLRDASGRRFSIPAPIGAYAEPMKPRAVRI